MRKGKDPDPDPYLWLIDPDPGGPKTSGSGSLNSAWRQEHFMIRISRSGKIMRRVLKKIANDETDLGDISTLAEPGVIQVSSSYISQFYIYRRLKPGAYKEMSSNLTDQWRPRICECKWGGGGGLPGLSH
jgi:hypothetical protein